MLHTPSNSYSQTNKLPESSESLQNSSILQEDKSNQAETTMYPRTSLSKHTPGLNVLAGENFDLKTAAIPQSVKDISAFWCLKFLRAIRDVVFASIDEQGLPSARVIEIMAVEPGRIFFLAPRGKAFYQEMIRNKFVAIVGQTSDLRMCRMRGRVIHPEEASEQNRLVDMMFSLNPLMKKIYPEDTRRIIDAFYIENAEGEYYDLSQKPILRASFKLGCGIADYNKNTQGRFSISESCTGCGICASNCPAQCILSHPNKNIPFEIQQEHCLRCGLCAEQCPHHAIEKRSLDI